MSGVVVTALYRGTSTIAPIYMDDAGTEFDPTNQVTSDADGMYSFYIEQGQYSLNFAVGGTVIKTVTDFTPGLTGPSGPANSTYETTAALEDALVSNVSAILAEVGKAGTFTIRNYADFIAEVAADVAKLNYIRSVSSPDRVWVRASMIPEVGAPTVATADGDTVQGALEKRPITTDYAAQSANTVKLGYGVSGAAAIKIGGNGAFSGEGIAMIGGAGPKDGGNGSYFGCIGHPNWPTMQTSISRNPIELALYGNNTTGVGTSSGTTTFTATSGTFTSADVGRAIWLEGTAYTVNSYTDSTHVVLNSAPPAGTYVWHIVKTTGSGTCTVAGGVVTRTLGDPFIPHTFGSGFTFKLNGTTYTVTTSTDKDSCTISSPPANGTYSYTYETNINDQIAALRIGPQFPDGSEENLSILARTTGYEIRSLYAGSGHYRDLTIGSGEYTPGSLASQIVAASDGRLVLGGPTARPTLLIDHSTATSVNYMQMVAAPTGSGPSFRARGSDANVGMNYDTKGTGAHSFTVGSFGSTVLQLYGVAGNDYLAIAADTGAPYIAAAGASANSDVRLLPKGAGLVRYGTFTVNADAPITGYISIKDAGGTTRKLAVIA